MARTAVRPLQMTAPGEVTYFSPTAGRELTRVIDVPVTGAGLPPAEPPVDETCSRLVGERTIFDRTTLRELTVPVFAWSEEESPRSYGKEACQSKGSVPSCREDGL